MCHWTVDLFSLASWKSSVLCVVPSVVTSDNLIFFVLRCASSCQKMLERISQIHNPFDALNTTDRQLTSLAALWEKSTSWIVITVLNLSLVFKSKNDTLSHLPVSVIAEVMNALWLSLARKHYFPSSDNVAICWKWEMFCSACHVLYMLRHPTPLTSF